MKKFLPIVTLAALLTGLNAVKPLHVDDTTYYFDAAQIAAHPLDPYGHALLYFSDPLPAQRVLAPPLLLYWWSAALRLFGEWPLLWKLWLFPLALLFTASLAGLLRRFAPATATPLLIALVLSPVFLPSLNLMIDIPALALSLTALLLLLRACDGDSPALAVLAGLTAGLAMQTKYTAFLAPPLMLIYALHQGKFRLGLAAALVAGLLFAAWETALFFRYGESHFVYQVLWSDNVDRAKFGLLGNLFPLLGGTAPTLALLALTVLSAPRWLLLLAAMLVVLPFFLLVCPDALSFGGSVYQLATVLFACNGAMVLLSVGWAAGRVAQRARSASDGQSVAYVSGSLGSRPTALGNAWFLMLWLALEIAGYVAISPFSAARRLMGTTIAATLVIGCLAEESPLRPRRRNVLNVLAVATSLLGLGFFAVDYLEARAEQQAAYAAAHLIRREHPQARIWYAGYWGFQYYAEKCGMKQIVPIRNAEDGTPTLLPPSHFCRGDWLVIPDEGIPQQEIELNRAELEPKCQIEIGDRVPLSTLMNFYAGAVPLRHRRGPRIVLSLFRVKDDFIAR